MALWGKTDKAANKPKYVALKDDGVTVAQDASGKKLVLIDAEEAALEANKKKGIQGPGWYLLLTTGTGANKRTRAELLISLADAPRLDEDENVVDESDTTETDSDGADLENP